MATPITKVWGVGIKVAEVLAENGYKYAEDLASAGGDQLALVPGFGLARAKKVIQSAKDIVPAEKKEPPKVAVEKSVTNTSKKKKTKKKETEKKKKDSKKKKKASKDKKKSAKKEESKKKGGGKKKR